MSDSRYIDNMRKRLEKSMPYLTILRPAGIPVAEDNSQTAREPPKTLHRKGVRSHEKDQR